MDRSHRLLNVAWGCEIYGQTRAGDINVAQQRKRFPPPNLGIEGPQGWVMR
jgi:hypothetical protein